MHLLAAALSLAVMSASPAKPFGPTGTKAHPVVGPVAAVPGNGPEPVPSRAPEEVSLKETRNARALRSAGGSNPLYLSFLLYKNLFTKVDGSRCQHYPTCSAYGVQAVGRYNVLGVFMTMDRLWQSGKSSVVRNNRLVYGIGPTPRFYDPVEDSAFWFRYPLILWLGPDIPTADKAHGRTADATEPESESSSSPHRH
ncbi:MAG: membrane protein insertion efficiency factor YidD [Myxococcota bacterium]